MIKRILFLTFLIGLPTIIKAKNYNYKNSDYILMLDNLLAMKDFTTAKKIMDKININSLTTKEQAILLNKFGFIYFKLNQYKEALSNYFKSIKLNNTFPYVYNNIGIIYLKNENYKNAKIFFLEALKLKKDYVKVLVNLAITDFYLKNYKNAFNWYKKALLIDKKYLKNRFDKKKAYNKLKELAKKNPEDKELQKMVKWAEKHYDSITIK